MLDILDCSMFRIVQRLQETEVTHHTPRSLQLYNWALFLFSYSTHIHFYDLNPVHLDTMKSLGLTSFI